jgi:membrane-associated phospholipid phosphatase
VTTLACGNATTRRLLWGLLPVGLVALLYDAMRPIKNLGLSAANVHLCDLRSAELSWFGIGNGGSRVTLHDWLQARASLPLDVFSAIPYGAFLLAIVGYAIYLFTQDFRAQQRFMWGFLILNLAAFLTYHVYPAAPPWYFHSHGCVIDLRATASAGPNLTRVDELMGIHYFEGLYGRSSDVFGAVPSLHVAYPLLMFIEGWKRHGAVGRGLLLSFYTWMCFSAVYLDHHWIVDVIAGSIYAVIVAVAMRIIDRWAARRFAAPPILRSPTPTPRLEPTRGSE